MASSIESAHSVASNDARAGIMRLGLVRHSLRQIASWMGNSIYRARIRWTGRFGADKDRSRRQADEASHRNAVLLEQTQEIAHVGGWEYNIAANRLVWTEETRRIHEVPADYDPNDVARAIQFFSGESRERIDHAFHRAVKFGEPYDLELQLQTAQGNLRWVRTIGRAEREAGRVVRVFGSIADVTERRLIETRFRVAAENLSDVIYEWDLAESVTWFGAVDKLMGFAPGEFPRTLHGWVDRLHPDDHAAVESAIARHLDGKAPYQLEYRVRKKDGTYAWWSARGTVLRNGSGQPVRWIGAISDVTDHVRNREELQRTNARLRQFIDSNIVGMVVASASGAILETNDYYLNLISYTRDEFVQGKVDWRALTPPEWLPADEVAIADLRRRGICEPYEKEYVRRDGTRIAVYLADTLLPGPEEQIAAFVLDVTDRKRAESEVRRLNADLERRVRERTAELEAANRELEAFSYSVSHDLRAPLRAIDGFSLILQEDYAATLDAEGNDHLRRVRAASQRMSCLIDDLLKLARTTRTEMHRAPVNLSAIAGEIAAELSSADQRRRVCWRIAAGLTTTGDAVLLRIVLENLLGNAWKFTANRPEAEIDLSAKADDGETVFCLRDNGAGFDMAYADRLFNPFQRLHSSNDFAGSGIGLATVQRIIRRHGGRTWAEGKVDHGAAVYFSLPDKFLPHEEQKHPAH